MPRGAGLGTQEKPGAVLLSGRQTVRVANTAISISTTLDGLTVVPIGCREVIVQADPGNQGDVAVGDVMITETPARGAILDARESIVIAIDQVQKVFVNGPTPGEGVCWLVLR